LTPSKIKEMTKQTTNNWILPQPCQIGTVVKDVEKTAAYYSEVFGLGPFRIYEFAPAQHWVNGVPTPIKLKIGKHQWGSLELEIIQVLEGEIAHSQFLREHGEGLQHLGYIIDDYDGWLKHLDTCGINVLMNAEAYVEGEGHIRAAYMESNKIGGVLFELMEITP
jgi:methylmalonyl-CoA/ethylmalonyl-CoA epimerase